MCGIAGFLERPGSRNAEALGIVAGRMADELRHRGPDSEGVWSDPAAGIALGHRRLAIIDLSPAGHQPMVSICGRYVLTYNGEIYNYLDLRKELEQTGHRFAGHSDTEIVLAAFTEWGIPAAVERLNGMFAMACWDRRSRQLELIRDRVGQKPLYYGWSSRRAFLFASELKALRLFPEFAPVVDRDALALFLRRGCIAAPYTIYRDVFKLPPGSRLVVRADDVADGSSNVAPIAYWSAAEVLERGASHPFQGTETEAVDALDSLLRDAVKRCMAADVPLGVFLSGGIDSSLVTALMQAQSDRPVRSFAIGFRARDYDEAPFATAVAAHLGTEHRELYATERDALEVIPHLPSIYDEPFADSSQIPTYLMSRLTRGHVTVALSGDGGDELFGGYGKYRFFERVQHLARIPRPIARLASRVAGIVPSGASRRLSRVLAAGGTPDDLYIYLASVWKTPAAVVLGAHEHPSLLTTPARWPRIASLVRRAMALDTLTYLPDDVLVKVDRAAMAVSLETRIPLLDHRVVEFAAGIPLEWHYRQGRGKLLLRKVLNRYVPPALVERPKMGFKVPLEEWLRGGLREWAGTLLDPARIRDEGFFSVQEIEEKWQEHQRNVRDWSGYLWPILMFQAWREHWSSPAASSASASTQSKQ